MDWRALCIGWRSFAEDAHEFRGGVGKASATTADQVNVPGNVELLYFYFRHPAVFDLPLSAHTRNDSHAHTHLHEALDAFDSGHLDRHVELGVVAREKLDDAAAKRRFDDMGDENFAAEIGDIDFTLSRERMFGRCYERELIFQNFRGLQLRVARNVGDSAEVEAIVQHLVRNVARKHAVNTHLHTRMFLAKYDEGGEQGVNGAFVDAKRKFTALETLKFREAFLDFIAQVDEALGVVLEKGAGVGHAHGSGAAHEERLAETDFELANGETDGGLRAIKTLRSARKAAFFGDGKEDLKFAEIHVRLRRHYKVELSKAE
jgi:hypothetical protein